MEFKLLILIPLITIANAQFPSFGNIQGSFKKGFESVKSSASSLNPLNVINNFDDFQTLFNKTYDSPAIAELRKQNFLTNRLSVLDFNEGTKPFKLALNSFADLLVEEFNKIFNGFKGGNKKDRSSPYQPEAFEEPKAKVPESIDWNKLGGVSPVKFQGQCASCHAFTAAGAVEGHLFRKTGVLKELSPQNLLDCTAEKKFQSFGCAGGGYVDEDLKYIWKNPGVNLENIYAYVGKDDKCNFVDAAEKVNITGYVEIPEGDEKALEEVVGTLGPVAVGIDASQQTFQFYSEGIYYDEKCKNDPAHINHAVLVVGYGAEPSGDKYWLVKNSYGTKWGIEGFVKIAKDKNNHCGIATSAVYPIV